MKKGHNHRLDEMQDQKLMRLEEYGYWIVFWALLASIVIQLMMGGTIKQVLGEIIVFLIASVYLSVTTLKNGLWTRTSEASRKGNAVISIIPAVIIATINAFKMIQNNQLETNSMLLAAAFAIAAYIGCFVILEVYRTTYNKRRKKLDDIDENEKEQYQSAPR